MRISFSLFICHQIHIHQFNNGNNVREGSFLVKQADIY